MKIKFFIIIIFLFSQANAADIEGAFGIKLGESFDSEIKDKYSIDVNKQNLLKNYNVNTSIIVEPFKNVRVSVGRNTNIVIGIRGSGDIDENADNVFDYCVKEIERVVKILEDKYQIKFTDISEVTDNNSKENYSPRINRIVETTSSKKGVDIKLSCKTVTESSNNYGTTSDIYIEYWDNNSMTIEKEEHKKIRAKKMKEAL